MVRPTPEVGVNSALQGGLRAPKRVRPQRHRPLEFRPKVGAAAARWPGQLSQPSGFGRSWLGRSVAGLTFEDGFGTCHSWVPYNNFE